MNKFLITLFTIAALLSPAYAQSVVQQGGTGLNTVASSSVLMGSNVSSRLVAVSTTTLRNMLNIVGGGSVLSVSLVAPTGLTAASSSCTTNCILTLGLQGGYVIPLIASTTEWASAFASTTALTPAYIRGLFSNTVPSVTYNSGTGVFSQTAGYASILTASTTEWSSFFTTPSSRITAGQNLTWAGNTLGFTGVLPIANGGLATSTAPTKGQVLLGNASGGYDLVATSSLGIVSGGGSGTVTSVSATNGATGLTVATTSCTTACVLGFSLTGGYVIPLVASTTEWAIAAASSTAASIRAQFSNTATGLTYTAGTGVTSLTAGYNIPLTASTTEWSSFFATPSTRITAGPNCLWTGNSINCTGGVGSATTTINGVSGPTFVFATTSDTNLGILISTSSNIVTFTPQWIGTLADGRISSAATWNAKLGQFFQTASGSALTIGNLYATSSFNFLNASGTGGLTATNIYGNIYPTGVSNTFIAVDPSGKIIATSTPAGTTYSGTYPIIVSGSVISSGFSTSTTNVFSGVNTFNNTTAMATTTIASSTINFLNVPNFLSFSTGSSTGAFSVGGQFYFGNASGTGLTSGSLYSANHYVTGLASTFLAVDPSGKIIATTTPTGGSGSVTSVSLTVPTGLTAASTTCTTTCILNITLTGGYVIPLIASTTEWATAYASSSAASIRSQFSNTATGLTYTAGTGVTSLTGGYNIPLTASTTEWSNFFATPSTRITAGANCSWVGNTFNCAPGSGTFSTTSINGLATTTFNFSTTSDTNIGLAISTSSTGVLFTPQWIGALADGRISSAATWNAKLGQFFNVASGTGLTVGNLYATSSMYVPVTNTFLAADPTGKLIATTTPVGTTYTGTYPIIVTGSVISSGFSTSTTNVFSGLNTFNATTTMATTTISSSTITNLNVPNFLSFLNASGTGLTATSLYSANHYVTGLASTFLAADPTGKIIATTTPSGSLSGGVFGKSTIWGSASTIIPSNDMFDNGLVSGINATSSLTSFVVQASSTLNPFVVQSISGAPWLSVGSNSFVAIGTTSALTNFEIFNTNTPGFSPCFAMGGNVAGDDDVSLCRTNNNDTLTGGDYLDFVRGYASSTTATATAQYIMRMGLDTNGYVAVGTTSLTDKLSVNGNFTPTLTDTYGVGSSSLRWLNVFSKNFFGTSSVMTNASSTNFSLGGLFFDTTNATGTAGQVLSSTGTSTRWITPSAGGSGNSAFTIGNGVIYNATSTDKVGIGTTSPLSTLDVSGTLGVLSVATTSNNYTLGTGVLFVYTGQGTSTFTLPALAGNLGRMYFFKNRATSTLTIQRAGSDFLYTSATTTKTLIGAGGSATIINDGTYWDVQ